MTAQIEREARRLLAEQMPSPERRTKVECGQGRYMTVTVAQALRALETALTVADLCVAGDGGTEV